MNKITTTILLILSCITMFAQEQKIQGRVMLDKDSLPVFEKNLATTGFTRSFFYCQVDFESQVSVNQFDNYNNGLKTHNLLITSFLSPDRKSIITIFPKSATRGISNLYDFMGNYFVINNFPQARPKGIKHIETVGQYDPLDKNRGFN